MNRTSWLKRRRGLISCEPNVSRIARRIALWCRGATLWVLVAGVLAPAVWAAPPVLLPGTLTLTPRADGNDIAQAWDFSYTETGWETHLTGVIVAPLLISEPLAGVLASHGKGGTGEGFGLDKGRNWFAPAGYVMISPDYTHAGKVGCRDEQSQCGGSAENIRRGSRAVDILNSQQLQDLLGAVVNIGNIYLYGNSLGGLTTIELAEALGSRIRAVGLTAAGVYEGGAFGYMTPHSVEGLQNIYVPVIHLHGREDGVIKPEQEDALNYGLDTFDKIHQQVWFPEAGHNIARGIQTTSQCQNFIIEWFDLINHQQRPRIASITPTTPTAGANVSIVGSNFGTKRANDKVTLNDEALEVVSWSATEIVAVLPAELTSGNLSVTVQVGPIDDPVIEQPVSGGMRSNYYPVSID